MQAEQVKMQAEQQKTQAQMQIEQAKVQIEAEKIRSNERIAQMEAASDEKLAALKASVELQKVELQAKFDQMAAQYDAMINMMQAQNEQAQLRKIDGAVGELSQKADAGQMQSAQQLQVLAEMLTRKKRRIPIRDANGEIVEVREEDDLPLNS
jgi:hypothetical protein